MEGRLTILVGMSNSGKTTYANRIVQADPKTYLRVNRDEIRNLVFGYTDETIQDYFLRPDFWDLEEVITKMEDALIAEGLSIGKDVILDNTHLDRKYIENHQHWEVPTEVVVFDVGLEEAKRRNNLRARKLPEDILEKQHGKYEAVGKSLKDNPPAFPKNRSISMSPRKAIKLAWITRYSKSETNFDQFWKVSYNDYSREGDTHLKFKYYVTEKRGKKKDVEEQFSIDNPYSANDITSIELQKDKWDASSSNR